MPNSTDRNDKIKVKAGQFSATTVIST